MYVPPHFAQTQPQRLQRLMHDFPLATVVTLTDAGLAANHIPLEHDPEPAPYGTLRGHVARANPLWRNLAPEVEALAIFQAPGHYVSPSWYPSKSTTGQVVPTYNYVAVHAYGPLLVHDDPTWVRGLVSRLTDRFEAGRADRWHVTDAPAEFIAAQLRAIVGIEIPITRLIGKWKVSQNRPEGDRAAVAHHLRASGAPDDLLMADWVEEALADLRNADQHGGA